MPAGKRVGVLGLARTGAACIPFLVARGAEVVALDRGALDELSPEAREAAALAHSVLAPYGPVESLPPLDMLIISPGVPTGAPIAEQARAAGAEVIGEVELAYRHFDAPMVAVTGTCGKGTTVTTLGALLRAAGVPHVVAGNIGTPLIGAAEQSSALSVAVVEISSFQLETTVHFRPHVAILLNITEDHLERYDSFEHYVEAKTSIFSNQMPTDWSIFCTDDERVKTLMGCTSAQRLTVSVHDPEANGRLEGDDLVVQLPGQEAGVVAERGRLPLRGDHHVINTLAAALAASIWDVRPDGMAQALRDYVPAPHLMSPVLRHGGVDYIDDSKATNPASAVADLSSVRGPVVVIAGGKEKQTDFEQFGRVLGERARCVVLMGECAHGIEQAVGRPELCRHVSSMAEAVAVARGAALPGDTVILCPGCSSLDMFDNYAQRGDMFARAVRAQLRGSGSRE